MCNKVVYKQPFMLKYCLDRYKTQKMCHKAVDVCLLTLILAPDWSLTNKMLKKLDNAVISNDYTFFLI